MFNKICKIRIAVDDLIFYCVCCSHCNWQPVALAATPAKLLKVEIKVQFNVCSDRLFLQ